MNIEQLRTKTEQMIESGEIELIGDAPAGPRNSDMAVYRETATGRYRIGDRHDVWSIRYTDEASARAVVEFQGAIAQARDNLDAASSAAGEAPTAALLEATRRLNRIAVDLYRVSDDLDRAVEEGGETGWAIDGPVLEGEMVTLDDGQEVLVVRGGGDREDKPTVEQLRAAVLKALRDHRAYEAVSDSVSWTDRTDLERDRLKAARVEVEKALCNAIIDQQYRLRGWEAERCAVVYKDAIYTPWGYEPDGGHEQILKIPLRDLVVMDEGEGDGEKSG